MTVGENDFNIDKSGTATGLQETILILDPAGKLKLVRWRLQSDGHRVSYMQDVTVTEPYIKYEQIKLVILNIDDPSELELLEKVKDEGRHLKIIAVTAEKSGRFLKVLMSNGVGKIVSRPIDYPLLSTVVREELKRIEAVKPAKNNFSRFQRRMSIPSNIIKICFSYRMVLDQLKTAIMVIDSQGVVKFTNRAMETLLKSGDEAILNRNFIEIMGRPALSSLGEVLERTIANLAVNRDKEVVISDNGVPVTCEAEACPVLDQQGRFCGAFLLVDDVSNPRKMEQVMAQSEKLAVMGQLAAGAAHEIRNPLTSVRGFIQLLRNELQGTPKIEYINIIINEIDRVNTIINEFLKLAKPVVPKRRPTNIKELVEDVRLLVEGEAFLNNITIQEEYADNLTEVMVDGEQIKQVLINAVRNAFEAMSMGGVLTIRVYQVPHEQRICLEISDTGTGMEESAVNRIFEPFFTTKENGTGLGMAVSSEIMKSHEGTIEIKSVVGQGTTVYLCLPG